MCKAVRILDSGELPGGVRHVCLQRATVQPRESAAGRELRDEEDHARGRQDHARPHAVLGAGESGQQERLGARQGLR